MLFLHCIIGCGSFLVLVSANIFLSFRVALQKLNTHYAILVIIKSFTIRKARFELHLIYCSFLITLFLCWNCIIVTDYLGRTMAPRSVLRVDI